MADHVERLLAAPLSRRASLRWLLAGAGAGMLPLGGCGAGPDDDAAAGAATLATAATAASVGAANGCAAIPEESAGPYPADGSNGTGGTDGTGGTGGNGNGGAIVNALALPGIVRSDIRASVPGAGSAVAAGTPLRIELQLVNVGADCAPLEGAAIYLWHGDRDARYSLYAHGLPGESYLRGVQAADAAGRASFTTIFPGCGGGRMPHVHVEVYRSLAAATHAANRIKTSQFTFPLAVLDAVYAGAGYEASRRNLANIGYATDNVFNDGVTLQMAGVAGSVAGGLTATLAVGVSL